MDTVLGSLDVVKKLSKILCPLPQLSTQHVTFLSFISLDSPGITSKIKFWSAA